MVTIGQWILKWLDRLNLTTTRAFISGALITIMLFTIILGGQIAYQQMEPILSRNVENYAEDLAKQVNGRLESLLQQADLLALQAVMDVTIQEDLSRVQSGGELTVEHKLQANTIINQYMAFSPIIQSIELYTGSMDSYTPVHNDPLHEQIYDFDEMITKMDKQTGKLFWLGLDNKNNEFLVAVRKIMLLVGDGNPGGYQVIKIRKSNLSYIAEDISNLNLVYLYDQNGTLINDSDHGLDTPKLLQLVESKEIELNLKSYRTVLTTSKLTGWTLAILLPTKNINEPISALRYSLALSGVISVLLVILLSYWISAPITRSIYQVRKIMQSARRGQLKLNPVRYLNREANELNMSYNKMVDDINYLIEAVYQKELAKQSAEIKTLQAQINPHFLYNTLEAINWILRDQGQHELATIILDLAALFRYSISSSEYVTLGQELDHIRHFLILVGIRLEDKLTWEINADEQVLRCQILKLSVQPIVENAIQHGIEPSLKPGHIQIEARREAEQLLVIVTDSGVGLDSELQDEIQRLLINDLPSSENINYLKSDKTGIGIFNVNRRLQMQYGEAYGVSIDSKKDRGACVVIRFPIRR